MRDGDVDVDVDVDAATALHLTEHTTSACGRSSTFDTQKFALASKKLLGTISFLHT